MDSEIVKYRLEWMQCPNTLSSLFQSGVEEFLEFAFSHTEEEEVPCPCRKCNNNEHKTRTEIKDDLMLNGIVRGYVRWIYHGEYKPLRKKGRSSTVKGSDDIFGMIHDALGNSNMYDLRNKGDHDECEPTGPTDPIGGTEYKEKFDNLVRDANQQLYRGCENLSKLSFMLRLFQIKCIDGMTNKAFTSLLKLFKECLPKDSNSPSSYYESRKIIADLGFDYVKIDACENDCMLFWENDVDHENYRACGLSRWQESKYNKNDVEKSDLLDSKPSKTPRKVLRYFPIIPRLQRLFMSTKIASDMRWHFERETDDCVLRHPSDAQAWKKIDENYPSFASDPRNVRLALASDGFNPYGSLRSEHSTWPVVLIPYNLSPWMCMKQQYCMLSLLIPRPKAPGNDIDVYLQPLIKDLCKLWETGVSTYDASKKEIFLMRAALMWIINDLPAYANLLGWSTKGYMACPCCGKDTCSMRLKNCKKTVLHGSSSFLAPQS